MGLIQKIKELVSSRRLILKAMEEQDKRLAHYRSLPAGELAELSDDALLEAALVRCDARILQRFGSFARVEHPSDALCLEPAPQTVYILARSQEILTSEGLFALLSGEARSFAPMLAERLAEVGAEEHRTLYLSFLQGNGLSPEALPSFSAAEATENDPLYPFEEFDRVYATLPPLEGLLAPYIRAHLEEF